MGTMKTEPRSVIDMALEHRTGRGRRASDQFDWVPMVMVGVAMLALGILIGVSLAH